MQHHLAACQRDILAPLFASCRPGYFIDAILEGHMGVACVDEATYPAAAMLRLGGLAFFGGDPDSATVTDWLADLEPVVAVWPPDPAWLPRLAQVPGHRLVEQERWCFASDTLDRCHLTDLARKLPSTVSLVPVDLELAERIPVALGTIDQIHNFGSAESFMVHGFGHALLRNERAVAAITTCATCAKGVEIQINVHPEHRRQGLATGMAAHFILDCLDRGLDPHWDAGNPTSRALALKLGYSAPERYVMPILIPADG